MRYSTIRLSSYGRMIDGYKIGLMVNPIEILYLHRIKIIID